MERTRPLRNRSLSEAKRLLIELLVNYEEGSIISADNLLTLYNGILYPRVERLNKQRVKNILTL